MRNILITIALSVFSLTVSSVSFAHLWYPPECCDGDDCRMILEPRDVRVTPEGYLIVEPNELIPFDKARLSPDGNYHRCSYSSRTATFSHEIDGGKCFWAPKLAS